MKVRFLGAHNVETLSARLPGMLLDGVLALDAGCLTSTLTIEEQLGLKAVLLTHQHYDHMRDIPMLGMNLFLNNAGVTVYGTLPVRDALTAHLLNGPLYPRFLEQPVLDFYPVEPLQAFCIGNYDVLPVPVNHSVPAVGYQINDRGYRLFYSGDTGAGLSDAWACIQPDVIIIEVTASNRWNDFGHDAGHLTPALLREELAVFKKLKGYLPPVYTVHMNPFLEKDIAAEIEEVARALGCSIIMAREGLELTV